MEIFSLTHFKILVVIKRPAIISIKAFMAAHWQ